MKYLISILLVFFCFLLTTNSFASTIKFNQQEADLMNMAFDYGKTTDYPEIFQAILLNETVAGRFGRFGDKKRIDWKNRVYGVMQVQYNTAVWVLDEIGYSNGFDVEELLDRLTYDDEFNMWVAANYFKILLNMFDNDWQKAALAYNVGPGIVQENGLKHDPNNYLKKIKKHLANTVAIFNTKYDNKTAVIYVVKKGDTLSKIAQKIYGDYKRWKEIHKLNPSIIPTKMAIGTELVISK